MHRAISGRSAAREAVCSDDRLPRSSLDWCRLNGFAHATTITVAQRDNTIVGSGNRFVFALREREHSPHHLLFAGHFDVLSIALLAANSCERLSKIRARARHIVERRIEDRFHESPFALCNTKT